MASLKERILHTLSTDGTDLVPHEWRRRAGSLLGAVLIGLVALIFANAANTAQTVFDGMFARWPLSPLVVTPVLFVVLAWMTRLIAPAARGSGIPQVIAASRDPEGILARGLLGMRTALFKLVVTIGAVLGGASVGREGPTVQLGAAIMVGCHRLFGARLTSGVLIAGGAAGVAAAFNTPIAGIAFAIEELASAYEQRVAVLVMGAVMISGLTSQGLAGNYLYFGTMGQPLGVGAALIIAPIAGLAGGAIGGLFSRALLAVTRLRRQSKRGFFARPLLVAFVCGVAVAALGIVTHGATWGTGYAPAKALLEGQGGSLWLGPAKFVTTLATSASGLPGGIFAPSLAVGAGFGKLLAMVFPHESAGAIVLLGMVGYFTGVVRAPLTGVIILSETTGSTGAILPLVLTALIADWSGSMVCKPRLYHALSRDFLPHAETPEEDGEEEGHH
ncbi:MAG: chloride channel protein [Sphingomonadales bacterium]|nr:chloride channel protein [Sphingomonadales bacterium]MDE2569210.1 chloride channel protein [Sphingomonadales bacterium]